MDICLFYLLFIKNVVLEPLLSYMQNTSSESNSMWIIVFWYRSSFLPLDKQGAKFYIGRPAR